MHLHRNLLPCQSVYVAVFHEQLQVFVFQLIQCGADFLPDNLQL